MLKLYKNEYKEKKSKEKKMKAVIAIDSLKGSLSSMEAGYAAADGIRRVHGQDAEIIVRPLADGGEGTVEALVSGMNGIIQNVMVTGPLGTPVNCEYGIIESSHTAVIEMSGAAGITLVPDEKRNPLYTTTYGVGEVIKDAISKGCRRFIVGIGGSATNDGGIGMLQALGYGFLDKEGKQVPFGARGLEVLEEITDTYVLPELAECEFRVACDVTNILCGEEGCSAVFGPQKGATPSMIMQMDKWLEKYAALAEKKCTKINANQAGTGAAGGLGFAFLSFTNAVLESGIKIVLEETSLEKYMENADIVITGEGRLDGQTAMGKAPVGVARLAKKHNIPVTAFAGSVTKEAIACNQNGIDAFFPILRGVTTLEDAMKPENAKANMADTVEQVFRLLNIRRK
jgi:glycerate kinase